ncbi:MAG: prepilin-type N-terminal cleavage/methylation domain-containing protein [Candidatus Omnitrophica bacterium]|nr:prepilin-type N-terminal cleavage/methylation domain-containing protein [Candidatus Omnitrophota bacterium]
MKDSFTLAELIIVVVIIGILAGIGIPRFLKAKRRTIDKEAQTNLKLIQTAERIHELEEGKYVNCSDNDNCSDKLDLDLPSSTASGGNWDYSVACGSFACDTGFTATATGREGTQNWTIDEDDEEPS